MTGQARARAAEALDAWFAAQGLEVEHPAPDTWFAQLAGERKRTIPLHAQLGERQLVVQSFFMRAPDENEAQLYAYLLRRNLRSYVLRFALNADGDVLLMAVLPSTAVGHDELDRLFGQLLATADDAFEQALRLGFASYIEREQAWRQQSGVPRNPIT